MRKATRWVLKTFGSARIGFWLGAIFVLLAALSSTGAPPRVRRAGTVLFKLRRNADERTTASLVATLKSLRSQGLAESSVKSELFRDCQLHLSICRGAQMDEETLCRRLMASGAVQFAQPDYVVAPCDLTPNDPEFGREWWHWNIETPRAWEKTTGTHSVLVAICDSGFAVHHPDLAENFVLPGYNVVDGSEDVTPVYSHGTSVAGMIGAVGNNGVGVAGMAWQISMLPIKITDPILPGGRAFVSDIVAGIVYAANRGAKIVNLSFDAAGLVAVNDAADYLRSRGGLLIVAAGNEEVDPGYPDYPSFLAVGATGSGFLENLRMPSHFGTFIDLAAPGDAIYTTGDFEPYTYFAGTSAATSAVSGLAALVCSLNPAFTPHNVQTILCQSCLDLGPPGEDVWYGHGRISAAAAVDMASGDLNRDRVVNDGDYFTFRLALGSTRGQKAYNPLADYDGDGRVTYSDYSIWYRCYLTR